MKLPKCQEIPAKFWYPHGAGEMELTVYRLTFHADVVCADDFLSIYELDKRDGKDVVRSANKDTYYGLSTLEDLEDARKLLAKVKAKEQRHKGIAQGTTANGQVRKTPSSSLKSHVTWWPYADSDCESQFTIIGGEKDE